MEALQEEFRGNNNLPAEIPSKPADETADNNLLKENNNLKIEISDLQSRIKRLVIEKNRMVKLLFI